MMKKLLLLLLLTTSFLSFGQLRDSVYVKTDIFEVSYSEKLEQPLRIKYQVLCPNGQASRQGMDFYTNDSIKTSDDLDYANNVYDKGHIAPAADFNCDKKMLLQTFSYLNCALQQENLNRGVWRFLELHERELAKANSNVTVKVELVFSATSKKLPTGATIPDGFIKIITVNNKVVEKYYFPNAAPEKGKKYLDYSIKF